MKAFTRNIALVIAALVMLLAPACGGKKKVEDNTPPQTLIFYFLEEHRELSRAYSYMGYCITVTQEVFGFPMIK